LSGAERRNGLPAQRGLFVPDRTDDQAETDRYWNAIVGNGGQESACGWCKDKWGISWQITPRTLMEALSAGGDQARRAFEAMMEMKKIDVAAIDAARRGT
jgi:predicted 3-demethylubiquinone-9 3-methyltransferase (glyoxalase superfamily)